MTLNKWPHRTLSVTLNPQSSVGIKIPIGPIRSVVIA